MDTHWEAFRADIDGEQVFILFNEKVASELSQLDLPNLLRVQVELEKTGPEGLPDSAEEDRLQDLEAELEDWIGALGGRYVAQVTGAGLRTMFYYVSCGREEAENLVRRIAVRKDMTLGMKMEPDPENRVYRELLLPTSDERRAMRDEAALAELRARGDDLMTQRPVQHTASFTNRQQAIAFANWARQNRFIVDGIRSPDRETTQFTLLFHRLVEPLPDIIDADTAAITRIAEQLGGQYQGWETELRAARTG